MDYWLYEIKPDGTLLPLRLCGKAEGIAMAERLHREWAAVGVRNMRYQVNYHTQVVWETPTKSG